MQNRCGGVKYQVIKGLSSLIPFIYIKYTQELLDDAFLCTKRMDKLGGVRFNYAIGEKVKFRIIRMEYNELFDSSLVGVMICHYG